MWCKNCNRETHNQTCELCGAATESENPTEVYWCTHCNIPIVKIANAADKRICPSCGAQTQYLCTDIRPVFPEERLLLELLVGQPFRWIGKSVWASSSRYYIDGKAIPLAHEIYNRNHSNQIRIQLEEYSSKNIDAQFTTHIRNFVIANTMHLDEIFDEACAFIKQAANDYCHENIVLSFSGGKDSTVTADLVVRALGNPSLVYLFGDTTLEFPLTLDYIERFRKANPKAIIKVARNKDQEFYSVCEDIGPPARMLRWCCSMFKTGPITRVLNNLYGDEKILTFYGIRKYESVARSKYNRIEEDSESIKIQKQKVASPIFHWRDIDIWLYILGNELDFNDAYRLGYDRVGCWCCPNNSIRAQFLSSIYMPQESDKWREYLIRFAKSVGKLDAEEYVDTGKWKARQGGNGLSAAEDVKIHFTNCTTEENAKIYSINKPMDKNFLELFIPFGRLAPEYGRKLLGEMIILDQGTNTPILSIQPYTQDGYENSVKIKTMNVKDHDSLQRMASYQVKKYNSCRRCLKCESICSSGAISISADEYHINEKKCVHCKKCISSKYLDGGCTMDKYLRTKI